jgi:hypothetical protein
LKKAIDGDQPIADDTIISSEERTPASPPERPLVPPVPAPAEPPLKVSEKQPEQPPPFPAANTPETDIPPLREQDVPPVESVTASEETTSASEPSGHFQNQLMDVLKKDHPSLAAGLSHSRLRHTDEQHLEITVTGSPFTINRVKSRKCMDILQNVCCQLLKKSVTIDIVAVSAAETEHKPKREQNARSQKKAVSHPLVADTLEIFGGNVIDVKIL